MNDSFTIDADGNTASPGSCGESNIEIMIIP